MQITKHFTKTITHFPVFHTPVRNYVKRRQKTVSLLTNSVHKSLEFSFTTLYFGYCHSYLNCTGFSEAEQQKEETSLTKCILWQFMSQAYDSSSVTDTGASALSHLWDYHLIPRAGSVFKITWTTTECNEYSSQVTSEGLTSLQCLKWKNNNGTGFSFREHYTSRIAEVGKLGFLIFSTAYKAKPCTSFSIFRINFYFLHY